MSGSNWYFVVLIVLGIGFVLLSTVDLEKLTEETVDCRAEIYRLKRGNVLKQCIIDCDKAVSPVLLQAIYNCEIKCFKEELDKLVY